MADPETVLDALIDRYSPEVAALGRAAIAAMRTRLPQANALVFENFNACGVGFAAGEKASSVILSLVLYPRWVNLFFFQGRQLSDPAGLLQGEGSTVRRIRLDSAEDLERPEIEALIEQAVDLSEPPLDPAARGRLVIRSTAGRRRPRRPGGG